MRPRRGSVLGGGEGCAWLRWRSLRGLPMRRRQGFYLCASHQEGSPFEACLSSSSSSGNGSPVLCMRQAELMACRGYIAGVAKREENEQGLAAVSVDRQARNLIWAVLMTDTHCIYEHTSLAHLVQERPGECCLGSEGKKPAARQAFLGNGTVEGRGESSRE